MIGRRRLLTNFIVSEGFTAIKGSCIDILKEDIFYRKALVQFDNDITSWINWKYIEEYTEECNE